MRLFLYFICMSVNGVGNEELTNKITLSETNYDDINDLPEHWCQIAINWNNIV